MTDAEQERDGSPPTSGLTRSVRLLGIPLGYAGRASVGLGRRALGANADAVQAQMRDQAAAQLFRVLGELKGGAMKFGQALSLMEAALPDDVAGPYREQLRRLQDSAPPMPVARVESVMTAELGPGWRSLFTDFGRRPAAAASIGQVHKATWAATGQQVAVKIQYPGAAAALRSDLAQLGRLASVIAPLLGGVDVKALVAEITERVTEEVDYHIESAHQTQAAEAFAGSPDFLIPSVVATTTQVLVTDWVDGAKFMSAAAAPDSERNRVGLDYVRFLFSGPARAGLLHGDPHPGNFLLTPDRRLAVLDWGLAVRLPDGLPRAMGELITCAVRGDADGVAQGLADEGFLVGDVDAKALLGYLSPFVEPAMVEEFHFTREWMQGQYRRITEENRGPSPVVTKLNVPPLYALIHRVWLGGVAVLSQLDVRARFSDILAEALPGYRP